MFVDFILKNIVTVYDKLLINPVENSQVQVIIQKLGLFDWGSLPLSIQSTLLKDRQQLIQITMNKWLPITDTMMRTAITELPNPRQSQKRRMNILCKGEKDKEIRAAIEECAPGESAPVIVYVAKMLSISHHHINETFLDYNPPVANKDNRFIGFARMVSGTLTRGQEVYVVGLKGEAVRVPIH